ncbi:MAG: hypothetical protein IKY44_04015 [Clostridia bacterium]|nr:hypothetical protein [Clostridia bacterium]
MKKIFLIAIVLVCALFALAGCHRHVSGKTVSCVVDEYCEKCGEVMRPATVHTLKNEATCTADGVCYVCGEVMEPKLGHVLPSDFVCTQDIYCTRCNELISSKTDHTTEGEATCTEDEVCTVCGEVVTEALGHTPGPEATATTDQVCMVCGEVLKYATNDTSGPPAVYVPETIMGGHYNNNIDAYYSGSVLVCGDYALEYFSMNAQGSSVYANIINGFADKYPGLNVTSVLVPKSATFNAPEGYINQFSNHQSFINNTYAMMNSNVRTADVIGIMAQHEGEYMFYRTDHHWTSLGAYYASVAYCNANGITARALSSYETVINKNFIGTLYSFCNSPKPSCLLTNPDYTVGHLPAVSYTTSGYPYTAIVQSANSYAGMFLGGDQAFLRFVTENKNGRKAIIFKESYGNAFAPYMIDYYEEVIVIDIRYATDSVESIIASYGITDVIIINNIQAAISLQNTLQTKIMS